MSSINLERLIHLVSDHPELYDPTNKCNGDMQTREASWQRISQQLNISVEVCKTKWNSLRGSYRRALRNKEGSSPFGGRKWRFEDDMSFLRDYVIEGRRRYAQNNEAEEDAITLVKEEPREVESDHRDEDAFSSCESFTTEKATPNKSDKEVDTVQQFFLSLAETVKMLPPVIQAQVKAEVFKSVNTAELKYLQEKAKENSDHTYSFC